MRVELTGGETFDLGETEATPTISIVDYSRRETDDFGVTTVVQRGFSRRLAVRLVVPTENVDALQRRLASLRATSARWVADDSLIWLGVEGFYKDFNLDLAVPPISFCTLTVEGLAETETVADTGVDPAPLGWTSTLRLLQPQIVSDAILTASTVNEDEYPQWNPLTVYGNGVRVLKAATHRVYESVAANNLGNDPSGVAGKWTDVGATNRWAMFDQALGSLTTGSWEISVVLDPAETVNAVALLDVTGSVRVQTDGYDRTVTPEAQPGMALFLDLPPTNGPINVSVSGSEVVSVGTLLVGHLVGLGLTEVSPSAGITDYSRKETDDFGDVTVVERAWAKRMSVNGRLRTDAIDVVASRIAAVRARPSLWIGDEGVEAITVYGFFRDFSIEVGPNVSKLALSIEGLSQAAPLAALPQGSVDWPDVVDSDPAKPKPDDGATNSANPDSPLGNGGKTVGDVLGDVDQVKQDVAGLFDTYGSTASAAQSAADAEAAKALALAARDAGAGFAQSASASRDDAAGSATAASASAVYASSVQGSLRPSTFDKGLQWWRTPGFPTPATVDGWTFTASGAYGIVAVSDTLNRSIAPKEALPVLAGKKYRVTFRARLDGAAAPGSTGNVRMGVYSANDADAAIDSNLQNLANDVTLLQGAEPVAIGFTIGMPGTTGCDVTLSAGATKWVPHFRANRASETAQPVMLVSFQIQDVTSELAAKGEAQAASLSSQAAAIKADEAGEHASAAQGFATNARTYRDDAAGYRSEASTSAQQSSEARSGAEGFASAAQGFMTSAQLARDGAEAQAGTALAQASIATDKAAAAQSSATLAASVSLNALNANARFQNYPAANGIPPYWGDWSYGNDRTIRTAGEMPGSYALQMWANANENVGLVQEATNGMIGVRSGDWLVLEADVRLVSGTLRGAGLYMGVRDAGGNWVDSRVISFAADAASGGSAPGAGSVGKTYRYSKLVQLTAASADRVYLHPMSNWDGFGQRDAKGLDWFKAAVRSATSEEIRSGTVIAPLFAQVQQQQGVIAQVNGRTAAYWQVAGVAGDNRVQLSLLADANGGGGVDIIGDVRIDGNLVVLGSIDTPQIRDNAVTSTAFAINYASVNSLYNLEIYMTSVSIKTTGKPVFLQLLQTLITAEFGYNINADASYIRLYRDGAAVDTKTLSYYLGSTIAIIDQPPAGDHVYSVYLYVSGPGPTGNYAGLRYNNCTIFGLENKK